MSMGVLLQQIGDVKYQGPGSDIADAAAVLTAEMVELGKSHPKQRRIQGGGGSAADEGRSQVAP
jgi:hypothetical protein